MRIGLRSPRKSLVSRSSTLLSTAVCEVVVDDAVKIRVGMKSKTGSNLRNKIG